MKTSSIAKGLAVAGATCAVVAPGAVGSRGAVNPVAGQPCKYPSVTVWLSGSNRGLMNVEASRDYTYPCPKYLSSGHHMQVIREGQRLIVRMVPGPRRHGSVWSYR